MLKVHTELGAGLLESAYDPCVYYEFTRAGLHFEHQVAVPIIYQGIRLAPAFRVDYIVENCLIVELKCVEKLQPVHLAQILTYLKLARMKLGLLVNFQRSASKTRNPPRDQWPRGRSLNVLSFVSFVSFVVHDRRPSSAPSASSNV